jgi:cobalt-precorrin 5A hydrolase
MLRQAIICLTKGGLALGLNILQKDPNSILYSKWEAPLQHSQIKPIKGSFQSFVGTIFEEYDLLIFIMATGIVVRSIAPYLKDKQTDPAILVVDEQGKNIISLLSGHLGRANRYTLELAQYLNANPVITTASDVQDSMAVDTLAMLTNTYIDDFKKATKITAMIVNGEKVALISKNPIPFSLPNNIIWLESQQNMKEDINGIISFQTQSDSLEVLEKLTVHLKPRDIIIGIGCRKGIPKTQIYDAICDALHTLSIPLMAIKHLATIDLKKNEMGIIETAQKLKVSVKIIDKAKIKQIETEYECSEFVQENIGVGAVAEPTAWLSSNGGQWLLRKKIYNGVTIAVLKEEG